MMRQSDELSRLGPNDFFFLLLLFLTLKQNFYCLYGRIRVWITEIKTRTVELSGYDPYAFPTH